MSILLVRPLVLCVVVLASDAALADPAFSFPSGKGGAPVTPSFDAVEATLFQVGPTDLLVSALGYEAQRPNQGPELAAIYDATSGSILASATVSGTDPLVNGYYYASIPSLVLRANARYYVGALHGSGPGEEYLFNTRAAQTVPYLTDLGTYFKSTSTLAGGTWQYSGGTSQYGPGELRHYVANLMTQPVPEPTTMAALGLGAVAMLRRRKRS